MVEVETNIDAGLDLENPTDLETQVEIKVVVLAVIVHLKPTRDDMIS
jgi:hypothetical protein